MYTTYWGLAEKPFENTPDPKFLYYSQQHEEAMARMLYIVREKKGAALLTGEYGCGNYHGEPRQRQHPHRWFYAAPQK